MPKWLLPTLSEVLELTDSIAIQEDNSSIEQQSAPHTFKQLRAQRQWTGAIAALDRLLHQYLRQIVSDQTIELSAMTSRYGIALSGPSPVLSHADVVKQLATWTLASPAVHAPHWLGYQLLPAEKSLAVNDLSYPVLPLLPGDPLANEQFCLVLTPWFSLVMVLGETTTKELAFLFSFAPEVVQRSWEALRPRILLMSSHQIDFLDELVTQFPPIVPDFRAVTQFTRLMLDCLPDPVEVGRSTPSSDRSLSVMSVPPFPTAISDSQGDGPDQPRSIQQHTARWQKLNYPTEEFSQATSDSNSFDVELVKAIAHEVRTPLTTIRTLTRSLLKRVDLPAEVLRRLGIIDRECSEQIDRFGLIFKAVELESASAHAASMALIRTSLSEVFQQSIPRWQQQASQRQMVLTVSLPEKMPTVVSDPTVLDQALTSLIERFTRSLPAGSHIQVEVSPAGSQLKVQLQSQSDDTHNDRDHPFSSWKSSAKYIGQMLMFQPETGSLSLNLAVTKNLFQAIGGKLIVKHRPQQGEVMTVYLPLEVSAISSLDSNTIITV